MVQASIFDILQSFPERIEVLASDLYLAPRTHDSSYIPATRAQARENYLFREHTVGTDGLAHHDIFSNFMYMKTLKSRGLIQTSEQLSKFLERSLPKYAQQLELTHLKPFL
jgi:hypothetical protein